MLDDEWPQSRDHIVPIVTSALSRGGTAVIFTPITTKLEEIHRDPAILDRAILLRERLDILAGGEVTATLLPRAAVSADDARRVMGERFAAPDWEFTVGVPMSRDERNARG